jgi:hypothetical protein
MSGLVWTCDFSGLVASTCNFWPDLLYKDRADQSCLFISGVRVS